MKTLVISGINLFEGGPLSIYYDCLDSIIENGYLNQYLITIFVHKTELFSKYHNLVEIIEIPQSRKSYICRFYYEYVFFEQWSRNRHVDIWISLHDITPSVHASKIYTYCHNPMPFFKMTFREKLSNFQYGLHSTFYSYIYRKNIHKATGVIVQQDWIRKEFVRRYKVNNVIVARPSVNLEISEKDILEYCSKEKRKNKVIFVFYSFPRFFKNFEVICEACKYVKNENIEVWLTIDGSENSYSNNLRSNYKNESKIKWLGLQSRSRINEIILEADYLIFPSRIETWGLPITEFEMTGKGIIVADLPYAHETVGSYEKVRFFNVFDAKELATIMDKASVSEECFDRVTKEKISPPYAKNWTELLCIIM